MFIVAKRNIILPSADGTQSYRVERGFIGEIPDWAAQTPYFDALVKDGKIGTPESKKDKAIAQEEEIPVNTGRHEEEGQPEAEGEMPGEDEQSTKSKKPAKGKKPE